MVSKKGERIPDTPSAAHGPKMALQGISALSREVIGERLRIVRNYRDMSQLRLATLAGFGCKEVVGRTESGDRELAYHEALAYARILCFCLNAFGRTEPDGQWNMMACLLPYTPPPKGPEEVN